MSLIDPRYECVDCGGYVGHVGDRCRRNPDRARLACTCPEPVRGPVLTAAEMAPVEQRFRARGRVWL